MFGIDYIARGIAWGAKKVVAAVKACRRGGSQPSSTLRQPLVDKEPPPAPVPAAAPPPPPQSSLPNRAGKLGLAWLLNAGNAFQAYGLSRAITEPFLLSNNTAAYYYLITTGLVCAGEYALVRFMIWSVKHKGNEPLSETLNAGANPALAAALPVAAGVQLGMALGRNPDGTVNLTPVYILGTLGIIFALHRLKNGVDSAQSNFAIVEVTDSPVAKAGNTVGRVMQVGGSALTLAYGASELQNALTFVFRQGAVSSAASIVPAFALAVPFGILILKGTLSAERSPSYRVGQAVASIDAATHTGPTLGVLSASALIQTYAALTRGPDPTAMPISLPDSVVQASAGVSLLVWGPIHATLAALRSRNQYAIWAAANTQGTQVSQRITAPSASATIEEAASSSAVSQFFFGRTAAYLPGELKSTTRNPLQLFTLDDDDHAATGDTMGADATHNRL